MTDSLSSDGRDDASTWSESEERTLPRPVSPASSQRPSPFELCLQEIEQLKRRHVEDLFTSSPPPEITTPEKIMSLPHDQLPNETWIQIFKCLEIYPPPELYYYRTGPIEDYPIQRMSRTCKRMRAFALPFMFSDMYLTTPPSVLNTISRVALRPDLIRYVRRLDIYVQAIVDIAQSDTTDGMEKVHLAKRLLAIQIYGIASILADCSPLATVNYFGSIPETGAHDMLTRLRPTFARAKKY